MIFVNTSFFLAVLNPRDLLHSRAQAWVETIAEPLLITEYVIWELVNGLSMPADRPKVHSTIQEIQTTPECGSGFRLPRHFLKPTYVCTMSAVIRNGL